MAENSAIEWCDHTFNPWIGCTKISPACDNCYAAEWDKRYNSGAHWGSAAPRKRTSESNWRLPLKWDRQAKAQGERFMVFCASLADVFDNQVPPEWRADLWDLIRKTPNLDWLLLTKRPQNILKMLPPDWPMVNKEGLPGWPNVWLGTTVEDQKRAEQNIPALMAVPAYLRFLSCEPLLGPLDLAVDGLWNAPCSRCANYAADPETNFVECGKCEGTGKDPFNHGIDWVIVGGESGPGARPSHPDWVRAIRDQCANERYAVPFFFKQWGDWHADALLYRDARTNECPPPRMKIGKKKSGRLLDGILHDEFPI